MARRRRLSPEEEALWKEVARTARPFRATAKEGPEAVRDPLPLPEPPPEPVPLQPFRLGEKAHPQSSVARPAGPAEALRMDARTYGKMLRGKLAPESRIDLHGMTLAEAHPALIRFLLGAQARGQRLVLVITGKGRAGADPGHIPERTGALRHQVPHWMRLPPLGAVVQQVAEAHRQHGGSGAFYVYLRRLG
jgi:DNA-nicking Smr family endonuclease